MSMEKRKKADKLTPEQRSDIARKAAKTRWYPLYDEVKATQVAALLLELYGGTMDYLTCIKILYAIEREALNRWMRPVIYDGLCSMPHGQAVSQTIDRAEYRERKAKSFWSDHIETSSDNAVSLIKDPTKERLSRVEMALAAEIAQEYKEKSPSQILREFHDSSLFPEYIDPHGSSIKTTYRELLRVLGKTDEQISDFEEDIEELRRLKGIER